MMEQKTQNIRPALVATWALLAVLSAAIFGWEVFQITDGGEEIRLGSDAIFVVKQPGIYTLWENWEGQKPSDDGELKDRWQIKDTKTDKVLPERPMFMQATRRGSSGDYIAICNYKITTPGSYRLISLKMQKPTILLLQPALSTGMVLTVISSFLFALIFFMKAVIESGQFKILMNRIGA